MKSLDPWTMPLGGTALIEASAGTGKTYTLTTLYLRLLVEAQLHPSQILVVTYTQAATAELRERVRQRIREVIALGEREGNPETADETPGSPEEAELRRLARRARSAAEEGAGGDPLRRALADFDEAAIFTIHGFCQRVLERNAFESGVAFDAELVEASDALERTLARDLWARAVGQEEPGFLRWLLAGPGRRWQFEPEALKSQILNVLGADEEMPVVPGSQEGADVPSPETAALRKQKAAALSDFAAAWPLHAQAARDWMTSGADLKKNVYKPETIADRWWPDLESFVGEAQSNPETATDLPDCWKKCTTAELARGVRKGCTPLANPIFGAIQAVEDAHQALEAAYQARALSLRRTFVDAARFEAKRRRERQHLLFFDDLLGELRSALRPPEGGRLASKLRDQYRFALIDEFQDTDPVQYEIFRRVWHGETVPGAAPDSPAPRPASGLLLIGDPKQAIYSFRGADLYTYLAAREDAGEAVYSLGTNWRSASGLIAGLNRLFARPQAAFGLEAIQFEPVAPRPESPPKSAASNASAAKESRAAEGRPASGLRVSGKAAPGLRVLLGDRARLLSHRDPAAAAAPEDDSKQPAMPLRDARTDLLRVFAQDVANLLDSDARIDGRPVVPSDIAVLARTKAQLVRARQALEALGIPCVDRGDGDVFESPEAWELLCVLEAMNRSGDPGRLRAALATGAMGWTAGTLASLGDETPELSALSERFGEYARLWTQFGFMRAFERWRREEGVTPRLLALEGGERRLTNWLHLAELLQRVETEQRVSRSGLAHWLERAIADPEARRALGNEASLLRLDRDDEAVCLMTLHRSKGLEFEIVYLPALWESDASRGPSEEAAAGQEKRNPPVRCYDETQQARLLDLGGPDYPHHVRQEKEENASEQRRLLYVGLTRARRQCVVLWGVIAGAHKTSLAALLHEPEAAALDLSEKAALEARKSLGEADWRRLWESLGAARAGENEPAELAVVEAHSVIEVESPTFEPRGPWQGHVIETAALVDQRPDRRVLHPAVTTSFSGLVQSAHRFAPVALGPLAQGRDLDFGVESNPSLRTTEPAMAEPDLAGGMDAFPRGAQAGTLLHQVLEETCLSDWSEADVRMRGRLLLEQAGFEPEFEDALVHVVRAAAQTPLGAAPDAIRLGSVPAADFLPEMEFTLSAAGDPEAGSPEAGSAFLPEALAALMDEAPAGSPLRCYAERMRSLSWRTLRGYLRGFIDAVFTSGGRYYLLDYKSNHLGPRQTDYAADGLLDSMLHHDYVLQYLIYSVALHRHLTRTLDGYDYDAHFGGVYYLFLRGLAESHPAGTGVFFDRPERDWLVSVSDLLGPFGVSKGRSS